jgi:hypothetical protein
MTKSHRQIKNTLKKKKKRDAAKKQKMLKRKSENAEEKRLKRQTYLMQETVRKMTAKISSITHKNSEQDK